MIVRFAIDVGPNIINMLSPAIVEKFGSAFCCIRRFYKNCVFYAFSICKEDKNLPSISWHRQHPRHVIFRIRNYQRSIKKQTSNMFFTALYLR